MKGELMDGAPAGPIAACHPSGWIQTNIQGVYKRIVWFQKLTRNLFLTLHGHNVHL